jgi:hypothetical protein
VLEDELLGELEQWLSVIVRTLLAIEPSTTKLSVASAILV